jgi:thiamine-phosphate pyrophosphorylase
LVQLREKDCSTREFVDLGRRLKAMLDPMGIPLIVNDRLDVAQAIDARGVHIGQSDMPFRETRRILGSDSIIGLSVESIGDAEEAEDWDVDYYGVSPIYATPTKTDTGQPWGLEGLKRLRSITKRPLVAIGGINKGNAAQVVESGADGVAVVSAICASADPEETSREIRTVVDKALRLRSES